MESTQQKLERRQRESQILSASGKAGGTVAGASIGPILIAVGAAVPPWSTIVAGAAALGIATTFAVVGALRKRGDKILSGDTSAVKAFAKRAAKWSASKRKQEAERLLRLYNKHQSNANKKAFLKKKERDETDTWIIKEAALRMKLQILTSLEIEARKDQRKPLIADEPDTTPVVADSKPDEWMWVAGGAAALGVIYLLTRKPSNVR